MHMNGGAFSPDVKMTKMSVPWVEVTRGLLLRLPELRAVHAGAAVSCGMSAMRSFFDCEDLFPYDEVVTSSGNRFLIVAESGSGSIDYDAKPAAP